MPSSCCGFATTTQPVADSTWPAGFRSETFPLSTAQKIMPLSSLVIANGPLRTTESLLWTPWSYLK